MNTVDEGWRTLPPAARAVFAIRRASGNLLTGTFLIGAAAVFSLAVEWPLFWKSYAAAILALGALGYWRGVLRWKHTAWQLDPLGLRIRTGKFWRSDTFVPRARVQHLDIDRGPIERRYGLATLTVYTAGSRHSAVALSGLADADATALRDALIPAPETDDDAL